MHSPGRVAQWLALAATLLGFAWRARGLGTQSFWWDEAYSAVVARGSLGQIVADVTAADFHPPLHYFLYHYWRVIAGESEYSLRYTSVIAGTLAIAFSFATGARLFGRAGGLVAAALAAGSPFLFYYSTEARMFALAALLTLLAIYLGHRAAVEGGARRWLPFSVAVAVGLYNYYYAVFIVLPIGLMALSRGPRRFAASVAAGLAAAALYLPWIPIALGRAADWTSPWTAPTSPTRVLAWSWPMLLTGLPAIELWRDDLLRPLMAAVAAGLGLAALASVALRGKRRYAASLWFAVATAALPMAAMAAIAIVRPIYHPRYAIPVEPGLILALAGAIALPSRRLLPLRVGLALCVALTFGWGLWRYYDGSGVTRDDYRSAVGYMADGEQPGDAAITNAPPGVLYYYRGTMPIRELPTGRYDEPTIVGQLNEAARGQRRLWYLTHALRPSDPEGFVDLQLGERARKLDERLFGQIRVQLYRLTDPPAFGPLAFSAIPGGARVGESLTLRGVGLDQRPRLAGAPLPFTLQWRVDKAIGADLGIWARLRDADGFAWGRQDRRPRDATFELTAAWQPGDQVTTAHAIPVEVGTPPGRYEVEVGVYRLDDLKGVDVFAADGTKLGPSLRVATVDVVVDPTATGQPDVTVVPGAVQRPTGATPATPGVPVGDGPRLLESGVSQAEAAAGSSVELTLLWKTEAAPGPRELVLRLLGADGAVAAERRGPPLGGRYPTERWSAGEVVRDKERLALPPTLPPASYRVWVGFARPGGQPSGVELPGQLRVSGVARTFEMPTIAHPREVDFGDGVRLAGWDVARPAPGQVRLTLYWRPSATPTRDYHVFNHVLDAGDKIVSQRDGVPVDWSRPTTGWVAGEAVVDVYELDVPPGGGPVRLRIGVYEPIGGQRLRTPDGQDHVDLTELPS